MTRLLIATTNQAKLAEYRLLLRGLALDPASLDEFGIGTAPVETGATFAENALLKARFYFARARIPTLADDGGLEIDALGGEPGVRSHRWLGEPSSEQALVDEVIRRMKGVEPGRRTARMRAAIALTYRGQSGVHERVAEAAIDGIVPERACAQLQPGFPYRAVLFLPERGLYLAELAKAEAAEISQRRIALDALRPDLERIASGPPESAQVGKTARGGRRGRG